MGSLRTGPCVNLRFVVPDTSKRVSVRLRKTESKRD